MKNSKKLGDSWPSDGHEHRDLSRDGIYLNGKIEEFLDSDRISLIIASKGMGKTLLMRIKHHELLAEVDGTLIIPSGMGSEKVQLDEPKIKATLSQTGFSSLLLWKGLWSVSILMSILAHVCAESNDLDLLIENINDLDIDEKFKDKYIKSIKKT